jgi:hypothetical protein
MRYYGSGRISVGQEFPLHSGELLRIRLGRGKELRVKVGSIIHEKPPTFGTELWEHEIGTNKEGISMIGNERKLRRV